MKHFIIGLALATICMNLKAQQNNAPYYPQPDLQKFEGKWLYVHGDTTFEIILKVEKTFMKNYPLYTDFIIGYHLYTKGQTKLQNSIGKNKTITSGGFGDQGGGRNKIGFLFADLGSPSRPVGYIERGTLELLSNTTAKWTIRPYEGIRVAGPGIKEEDYNIYIPRYLILKRVK